EDAEPGFRLEALVEMRRRLVTEPEHAASRARRVFACQAIIEGALYARLDAIGSQRLEARRHAAQAVQPLELPVARTERAQPFHGVGDGTRLLVDPEAHAKPRRDLRANERLAKQVMHRRLQDLGEPHELGVARPPLPLLDRDERRARDPDAIRNL